MKPTLLVLAAGMGSRYGGLKQLDGVGPHGETIMDYSVYDALQAGFGKIVFVIRHDFEDEFRQKILSRYENAVNVDVVFQGIDSLPDGYTAPQDRTRPWGTGHAIMMGSGTVHEPFAVINADDFYGRQAFRIISDFLTDNNGKKGSYCMVAFKVGNTMTPHGSVSRGVCTIGENECLSDIVERRKIMYDDEGNVIYMDEDAGLCHNLDSCTPVSMNLWGFTPDFFDYSNREFKNFLDLYITDTNREFYVPTVVDTLIKLGEASVKVLTTDSHWFGVTYGDDRHNVCDKLAALHAEGVYPENLF